MPNPNIRPPGSFRPYIRSTIIVWLIIWSAAVFGTFMFIFHQEKKEILDIARDLARSQIEKDLVFRKWSAQHGGVYVPVTADTPPNPYLSNLPERDLTTPSGRRLTLMNPAYMMRQVYALSNNNPANPGNGRITSLRPLNPNNSPDPWEEQALRALAKGVPEVSAIARVDGKTLMIRMMRPLPADQHCWKCHAEGSKTVDNYGGISLGIRLDPFLAAGLKHMDYVGIGSALLWLLGVVGIGWGGRRLEKNMAAYQLVQEAQQKSEKKFRKLFEEASDAIILTERGTHAIIDCNQATCELWGRSKEELIGKTDDILHPPEAPWEIQVDALHQ
ncbi:MAG: DUF3365 domain-containing protein, partial [Desulfobaccales bacterium]